MFDASETLGREQRIGMEEQKDFADRVAGAEVHLRGALKDSGLNYVSAELVRNFAGAIGGTSINDHQLEMGSTGSMGRISAHGCDAARQIPGFVQGWDDNGDHGSIIYSNGNSEHRGR